MENRNFRLQLDSLEDRSLPSATVITPSLVIDAYVNQAYVTRELQGVQEHLKDAETSMSLSFLPTQLTTDSLASQADVNVLSTYLDALKVQLAATPNNAELISHAALIQQAVTQSTINTGYAELYALGYGASPIVPPAPPPPPADNGPNFGNNGNLPFSLTDPSWVTIANGVRTWDVTPGTGTTLATGTQFHANYTGYLTDGTVFDSSAKSGVLNGTVGTGLITGFSAGLVGMQVGGTRRIDIPGSQAYGANPPSGSGIPANAELIFEVTLISSP